MKLRTKMVVCMAIVFAFFTVALSVALVGMQNATKQFEVFVDQDQAFLSTATKVYAQGLQMGASLRNILLEPTNETPPKVFAGAQKSFQEALQKAVTLAGSDQNARQALEKVSVLHAKQLEEQKKVLSLLKESQAAAIEVLTKEETPIWRKARIILLDLIATKTAATEKAKSALASKTHDALILSLLMVAAAIIAGAAVAFWLTRNVMRQLGGEPDYATRIAASIAAGDLTVHIDLNEHDQGSLLHAMRTMQQSLASLVSKVRAGTDTIAAASTQITAGNQDLSSRTEEQASSLEETASSMEELTATVKQNADNARQANQLAANASDVAAKGGDVVAQVVGTMGSINESSRKIVDIIGVIDGIAFQTNILALNAAVEAARAGEQGRGFAVVASEVRSLAQRSAAAAKEIKTLIGDSVEKVDAGSRLVDQAGATMDEVVDSVKRVTDIMAEISAASLEQSDGIEQVNQAIGQMDEVTQQNAALVEEAAAAAESMQDQAAQLAALVGTFKVNDETQRVMDSRTTVQAAAPKASAPAIRHAVRREPVAAPVSRPRLPTANNGDGWEEF